MLSMCPAQTCRGRESNVTQRSTNQGHVRAAERAGSWTDSIPSRYTHPSCCHITHPGSQKWAHCCYVCSQQAQWRASEHE